jgi:uncharacterized membrane protein
MDENKTAEVKAPEKSGGEKNITMAIVAYFLFFVPLLTESKNDPFVKFHVKQGLLLFILAIVNMVIGMVISFIWFFIGPIVSLGVFVLWIMGVINAANGKMQPVPVVGQYAEQYLKF